MSPAVEQRRRALASLRQKSQDSMPPLTTQARTFGSAVASAAGDLLHGHDPRVDDATQAARLALCNTCEHLRPGSRRCVKCGCKVDWKTTLKRQQCPEKKWLAVPNA